MSFWDLSTGDDAKDTGTSYETPTQGELIPDDSSVLATPDEVKWDKTQNGDEYLSIRWAVQSPEELAGRKVFHKLWVTDHEPRAKDPAKKKDKALKMFAAIDANAGGKLGKKQHKPTDDDLAICLIGKQMVLKIKVYDMSNADGTRNVGNWVAAVSPKGSETKIGTAPAPKRPEQRQQRDERSTVGGASRNTDFDDEIPF